MSRSAASIAFCALPSSRLRLTACLFTAAVALTLLPGSVRAQPAAAAAASGSALPASGAGSSIVGGVVDQAREAGRQVGQEARRLGGTAAQGAREAASAASAAAKEAWRNARQGARQVGEAASAAKRELSERRAASQPPAPVEHRDIRR